jgi:hypothetical protein
MVSKIEVHTSLVTLLVVQISKFVFNCGKLCVLCPICGQCIVPFCKNHLDFLSYTSETKICFHANFLKFLSIFLDKYTSNSFVDHFLPLFSINSQKFI